jgi:hypothetical protein
MPNWVKQYKDKEKARNLRNIHRKRNYAKTQGYPPRDWTTQEMDLILSSNKTDAELSEILNRSVQSIQIKRCRLKKEVEV